MEFIKKNFAILLAFMLPIILIVGVALSTYLPSLFLSTDYNFVYTACVDGGVNYVYNCDNYLQKRYSVINNKLVVNSIDFRQDSNHDGVLDFDERTTGRIFLYDTKKNESREITLEEAQTMTLNNLMTSPDGVAVSGRYDGGGGEFFIFGGGSSSYGYYLTKGKSRSKINLINDIGRYYNSDGFQFIGWVLPGRK